MGGGRTLETLSLLGSPNYFVAEIRKLRVQIRSALLAVSSTN
jgi:hypothetical protein